MVSDPFISSLLVAPPLNSLPKSRFAEFASSDSGYTFRNDVHFGRRPGILKGRAELKKKVPLEKKKYNDKISLTGAVIVS